MAQKRKQPAPNRRTLMFPPTRRPRFTVTAERQRELDDAAAIHRAMHTNDPEARRRLVDDVCLQLKKGVPLSKAKRRWLRWSLIVLRDNNRIPHLARGNRVKGVEERKRLGIALVAAMRRESADRPIRYRLENAAHDIGIAASRAGKLYYDREFFAMCERSFLFNPRPNK